MCYKNCMSVKLLGWIHWKESNDMGLIFVHARIIVLPFLIQNCWSTEIPDNSLEIEKFKSQTFSIEVWKGLSILPKKYWCLVKAFHFSKVFVRNFAILTWEKPGCWQKEASFTKAMHQPATRGLPWQYHYCCFEIVLHPFYLPDLAAPTSINEEELSWSPFWWRQSFSWVRSFMGTLETVENKSQPFSAFRMLRTFRAILLIFPILISRFLYWSAFSFAFLQTSCSRCSGGSDLLAFNRRRNRSLRRDQHNARTKGLDCAPMQGPWLPCSLCRIYLWESEDYRGKREGKVLTGLSRRWFLKLLFCSVTCKFF